MRKIRVAFYSTSLKHRGWLVPFFMLHALLYMTCCCPMEAKAQTPQQWRDSLNSINNDIRLFPNLTRLHLQKAAVLLQLLDWNEALEECNTVLLKDEGNLSALFYRAYANNQLHRCAMAKDDYEEILKQVPKHLEARIGLVFTLIRLNRLNDALDHANILVEMHPDNSEAYAARAGVEMELKQYDTALYDWEKAIALAPQDNELLVQKAETLIALGRKQEAKATLDLAVKQGTPKGTLIPLYKQTK